MFGSILLKDTGVESQLDKIDKKAGQTSGSMGLSFGSIASAALKVATVIGAGMGIKDMVDNASKAEDRMAQMNAVLKSTGGAAGMTKQQLIDLADAQSKLTTYSKGANEESENLLLTFTNIGKKTFPDALKTVNDMSTALGQDTKSSAIQLGKALNDPINGMTALKRVGVQFTDSQKEQIKTLQKSGDMVGAQSVILKELQKEFGGSAEAAGSTFGGKLTILKNNLTGLGTSIMSNVMPYLSNFVKIIIDNMPKIQKTIKDVLDVIVPKFKEWMGLIGDIVKELFPNFGKQTDGVKGKVNGFKVVLDTITNVLKFVKDNINLVKAALVAIGVIWAIQTGLVIAHNVSLTYHNIQAGIATIQTGALAVAHGAQSVALGVATAAQWLFNAATGANPIGAIILLIVALIAIVILIATHWKEVSAVLMSVWKVIVSAFDTSIKAIVGFFTGLWNGIVSIFGAVGKWFGDVFNGAWKAISGAFSAIGGFFQGIWDGMKSGFSTAVNFLINGINSLIKLLLTPLNLIIKGINLISPIKIPELKLAIPNIPKFAVGTRYLPQDMLIQAHKGEMIVPKSENPYANSGGGTMPKNGLVVNISLNGNLVGSNGMNEFATIISQKLAGQYGLATGGAW